jgi:hypothetical protein
MSSLGKATFIVSLISGQTSQKEIEFTKAKNSSKRPKNK